MSLVCRSNATNFWKTRNDEAPAFIYPDGTLISYRKLTKDVEEFSTNFFQARGPIGILCNGQYRQYVAYLAALNSGCPVLLMGENQASDRTGLSLAYFYSAETDELVRLDAPDTSWHPELAVLLSTSGSTGSAKWVRLSFQNVASNAASIVEYLSIDQGDRAPMALPFQYSYGMSVVNSHLAVGAAIVLIEGSVVDARFWDVFGSCRCTSFAGVPHSFELMEKARIRTDHLDGLRYMTQAGGRLDPARVSKWVRRGRAEGWDFFVMYGQTEAAPRISYLPPDMALDTPSAIGIPVPGGEMWVADEDGMPIADGMTGELIYRGPNTMMGYAESDADLLEEKGSDLLNTGDIARRLPNGLFEIVGRKNRFVKLFGLRIGLDEVDKHLQAMGLEAACVACDDVINVLVADGQASHVEELEEELANWLGLPTRCIRVFHVDTLPRQATGKVDLQALSSMLDVLMARNRAESQVQSMLSSLGAVADRALFRQRAKVSDVFSAHFPTDKLTPETSFNDLGGDSLNYVAVSIELEAVIGHLPENWPEMSVMELEVQSNKGGWTTPVDTPTLFRALAIMLVVAGHLDFLNYGGGGALTLFVVVGMSLAAFTLPQVFQSESVIPIAVLAIRIAILTFAYTLLNYVITGYGDWPAFLFIGNWVSPHVAGSAWFIEVFLQMLCVLMLLFAVPKVRRITERQKYRAAIFITAVLIGVAAISDAMVDTHHLFRRLPHILGWMILIGVAAWSARSVGEKAVVTAIFLLGVWQYGGFQAIELTFFPLAVLVLIWLPSIRLPKFIARAVRMVAGASLIIYLSHFQIAAVSQQVFGDHPAVSWAMALVGGLLVWRLYDPADVWLSRQIRGLFMATQRSQSART